MASVHMFAPVLLAIAALAPAQIIDYHQHLYSPVTGPISIAGWQGVTADELIHLMNEAHVSRAVVLSTAYSLANPHKPPVAKRPAQGQGGRLCGERNLSTRGSLGQRTESLIVV